MDPQTPNNTKPKKTWKIIIVILVVLVVLAAGWVAYLRYFQKEPIEFGNIFPGKNKIVEVINPLDGTKVDKSLASRHPLAVMVENHPDSRPHSGLDKASIVYEAITEGGITRFMAIYGPRDAKKVGPVRSARTYFVDWVSEFDAFYAHVGGNLDALEKIKAENILDLDQFALGEKAYWREPKPGIAIEHTMYTDTTKLYAASKTKGWPLTGDFTPLKFRDPKKSELTQKITVDFSEPQYRVVWNFDPETNTYLRMMAGSPHKDAQTGVQLAPANVIVQEMERSVAITTINEQGWAMKTVGTGKAKIYIEGKETAGTWKKTSRTARTIFYDEDGDEVRFIPGQFWIQVVPPEVFSKITTE